MNSGFKIVIFLSVFLFGGIGESWAQIAVPKTVEPDRFRNRFKAPQIPRSDFKKSQTPLKKAEAARDDLMRFKFFIYKIEFEGYSIYRDTLFKKLEKYYRKRTISLFTLYQLADKITAKYRNDGYILSRAYVPAQNIRNGVAQIKIVEGYINKINLEGDFKNKRKIFDIYSKKILKSRPLDAKVMERYLLLFGDLPGMKVKTVITPSPDQQGASQLKVILSKKNWDANLGMDNRGNRFNGPFQASVGANLYSPVRETGQFGFQSIFTTQLKELQFFNFTYQDAISYEGTRFVGSVTSSFSQPGSNLETLDIEGDSLSISGSLFHPVIRSREMNLNFSFGFSAQDSETDIVGNISADDSLRILTLGASFDFVDKFRGINLMSIDLSQGLDILSANQSGSANLSRADGKSDFTKFSGILTRLQNIKGGFSFLGAMNWQYSLDNLLSSQEFGVGGSQFVRAYDSSEITGEQGIALKLEFQYGFQDGKERYPDYQTYAFYDYGTVWNKDPDDNTKAREGIDAIGAGVRFNINEMISGYAELDLPLARRIGSEDNKDPRFFFSVASRFN
jgi:hemolysin activation/secretion protein